MASDEEYMISSDVEEEEEEEEDSYYYEETLFERLDDGDVVERKRSISSVITKESLFAAQKEDLCKVMDLLAVSEHHARTLLIFHRWDVERIFELLEQKGRKRLFSEAGVTIIKNKGPALSRSLSLVTCNICFEDVSPNSVTEMACGHCYCNDCWTEHFIVMINDGQSRRISCMAHKCNAICDEAIVRSLVMARHPDIASRFDRVLLESYIEDNKKVKWCPSIPHCGNAIHIEGEIYCEVECTCGLQFCFGCSSEAHSPCSCVMWELWTKKCQVESENLNWITVNTKHCPKCHKPVEKNGGCNIVLCVCREAFCWLCASPIGNKGRHSCGRYKNQQGKKNAGLEIYRYMHYYRRYKAHTDSFKQESKLKKRNEKKISILESKESGIRDFSWVLDGLSRLFRSRRILSYSYPFAYYMFGDELFNKEMPPQNREMKQNLFEDQQQQLEFHIERLSMFLEKDFHCFLNSEVVEIMRHVINLSSVVDKLCKQMYQCIENDLLYSLQHTTHIIAPYQSQGVEKAFDLSVSRSPDRSLRIFIKTNNDCFVDNGIQP